MNHILFLAFRYLRFNKIKTVILVFSVAVMVFLPLAVNLLVREYQRDLLARANATRYGLNASVWSRRARHALQVARRLRAGTVNVNEAYAATWGSTAAPIGGMKESGLGRRHGAEGILKYTEAQTVAVQRGHPIAPPAPMSGERYERTMAALVRLMRHVPGLR